MPIPTVYGRLPFINAEQVCVSPQFKRDNPMYGVVGADNVIYTFLNSDRAAARAYFEGLPSFTSWTELDASTSMVSVPTPTPVFLLDGVNGTQSSSVAINVSGVVDGWTPGNYVCVPLTGGQWWHRPDPVSNPSRYLLVISRSWVGSRGFQARSGPALNSVASVDRADRAAYVFDALTLDNNNGGGATLGGIMSILGQTP